MSKKLFKTSLWVILACTIVFGVIEPGYFSWRNLGLAFFISTMYTMVNAVGQGILNDYLDQKWDWITDTKKRLWYGVSLTVITVIISVLICNYVNFVILQKVSPDKFFSGQYAFANWFFINLSLLISAILHARGFMLAWKAESKKEVVEQKIIASSANAQFESLKNQLDPHFLFNSLNVLSSLIDENPDQAQKFTASMSKIYRYILDQKDKEVVTLEEEINFARTYIELLKYRFEDSISFDINVNEEDSQGYVVPLSLQLLLENCIKHNLATSSKPLHIEIFVQDGNLIVKNNLQKRELPNEKSGIGLANIVQRYKFLTRRNVFIESTEESFSVKIPLLIKVQNIMENLTPNTDATAYNKAARRVQEIKKFYGNLISYCCVIPFLAAVNLLTAPQYLWFIWPMLGWGLGLAIHAFNTFGIGKSWEEKKIQEIMNKNNQSQTWK